MFVDASALVAIIADESDGAALGERLNTAERRFTSPIAIYEATVALLRIRDTAIGEIAALLNDFMEQSRIEPVSITPQIGWAAIDAFARFGRGNHPARLSMGDCFAYACARSLSVPLLAKGGDFAQTDVALA